MSVVEQTSNQPGMRIVSVGACRLAMMRRNTFGERLESGWILFGDTNLLDGEVLLVSQTKPILAAFAYDKPYHSVTRARILASRYAESNPQTDGVAMAECA
ncbi:MAG: hypothetical protein E6Q40_11405 [Cupriavidus sp.]|nr:MAG: hypothetical protein E6Q40_11405 [Cupriavidus sp.]